MNKPDPSIPEEMLSAYLDDELTVDERQQVVTAIEHDEHLRALLADLKQVRLEIQSLPRHALSTDFAAQIANAACQARKSPAASVDAFQTSTVSVEKKVALKNGSRLNLIAGIAATAAAIFVAFWAIDSSNNRAPLIAMSGSDSARAPAASVDKVTDDTVATGDNEDGSTLSPGAESTSAGRAPAIVSRAAPQALEQRQLEAHSSEAPNLELRSLGDGEQVANGGIGQTVADGTGGLVELNKRDFEPGKLVDADAQTEAISEVEEPSPPPTSIDEAKPYDAIVSIAGPRQLLENPKKMLFHRLDDRDSSISLEALGLLTKSGFSNSNAQLGLAVNEQQLNGIDIPENSMLMVLEGTREQLQTTLASLNVETNKLAILQKRTRALDLGLLPLRSRGANLPLTRRNQSVANSATRSASAFNISTDNANDVVTADDEQASKEETADNGERAIAESDDAVGAEQQINESLKRFPQQQQELAENSIQPARYRVLLIVQPK